MKTKILIIGLMISSAQSYSKDINISLNEALELAKTRNESVEITNYQLEEATTSLKKAYSGLYPSITLDAKAGKTKQDPGLNGGGITSDNYQQLATVTLAQPIYTFGRLSGAIDAAKAQGKFAQTLKTSTFGDIELTVKKLFLTSIFYKRQYEISKESYENALENQKALKKRVSYGRISQDENLKMKADIASRKPLMIEAQKVYESSISELKNFLNIDDADTLLLSGSLETPTDLSHKKSIEYSELVKVKLLKYQFDVQKNLEDIESANYLPTLSFFASYGQSALFENVQEDHYLDQTNTSVGLNLTMSFSLGGEEYYDRQVSRIKTKIKKLELDQGERELRYALKSLYDQGHRLNEKKESLSEAVSLAKSSYQVALNSFANGSISQTQLNDRELLLTNNKIAYAQNLLQIQLVNAQIKNIEITK